MRRTDFRSSRGVDGTTRGFARQAIYHLHSYCNRRCVVSVLFRGSIGAPKRETKNIEYDEQRQRH